MMVVGNLKDLRQVLESRVPLANPNSVVEGAWSVYLLTDSPYFVPAMQVPSEVLDLCMHESSAPVAHAIDGDNMAVTVLLRGYDRNDGTVVTLPRLLANMFNEIVAVVKASADNGNTQHQRLYYVEAISNMLLTYLDLSKVADRSVTPWS